MPGYKDTYQAALESDTKEKLKQNLDSLLKEEDGWEYNLDEKIKDKKTGERFTAASRLAYEDKNGSNVEKVKWLYELGANAYEIVKGYAMASNDAPIEFYLDKASAMNKLSTVHQAYVRGSIFAKRDDVVQQLWKLDDSLAYSTAEEYAIANNVDKAFEYYTRINNVRPDADKPSEREKALPHLFTALAKNGFNFEENSPFKQFYEKAPSQFYPYIIEGYAVGGKTDLLINYIEKIKGIPDFAQETEKFAKITKEAFWASARYGHHDQVKQLYKKYADKDTNETIRSAYDRFENYKSVNQVVENYLKNRRTDPREYKYSWLPKFFQKSLTDKENAVNALEAALRGEAVDLMSHLETLRNGNLGNELRAFIKSGMWDYLEVNEKPLVLPDGGEIRTVTDFVTVLNEIVNPKPGEGYTY